MNVIFKGDQIILPNGSPVLFHEFIKEGNKKIGWLDNNGDRHKMSDLTDPAYYKRIVRRIEKGLRELTLEEKYSVHYFLSFHECEPMAAAERISKELNCDYQTVLNLL